MSRLVARLLTSRIVLVALAAALGWQGLRDLPLDTPPLVAVERARHAFDRLAIAIGSGRRP